MTKKILIQSVFFGAVFVSLCVLAVPLVSAETPPYYVGPAEDRVSDDATWGTLARVGGYYYTPGNFPCVLHQAYRSCISPVVLRNSLGYEFTGCDDYGNTLYYTGSSTASGYAFQYYWPIPYCAVGYTACFSTFLDTSTNEVITPERIAQVFLVA
jgi:hypothetical protein